MTRRESVDADAVLFFEHQLVKDSQNLFAVGIHAAERVAEVLFVALWLKPFIQQRSRDVDVAAEVVSRVPTEEQAVEDGGLPLRRQRIQVLPTDRIETNYAFLLHSNTSSQRLPKSSV